MGYSRNYSKYFEKKKRELENHEFLLAQNRDNDTSMIVPVIPSPSNAESPNPIDEKSHSTTTDLDTMTDEVPHFNDAIDAAEDKDLEESIPSDNGSSITNFSRFNNGKTLDDNVILGMSRNKVAPSIGEVASFQIMTLLDRAGSPRYLYDELMALLNKQLKKGLDISQLISRTSLMQELRQRFKYPEVQQSQVSGFDVYKFPFLSMLQDLCDNCGNIIKTITKGDMNVVDEDKNNVNSCDLWNSPWIYETLKSSAYDDFDNSHDILLPLIIYMDKTGTDALQRYSLEPVLFTTAAIPRQHREHGTSWRHLGFIPPLSSANKSEDDDSNQSNLQMYHNLLSVILEDLIAAQKNPPIVAIKRNGVDVHLRARLPVMIVMGDQKSQDTLCGRKHSNSGGAGRVHRSCMCSYVTVDDPNHTCVDVNIDTIRQLTKNTFLSDIEITTIANQHSKSEKEFDTVFAYLKRQRKMNSQLLQFPFTLHAIKNAFDPVDFGAWSSGIFTATFDDFMHSTESGLFEYTSDLIYKGLTDSQNEQLEPMIQNLFGNVRSSVRSTYPRWRITDGFTRQSLMTCGEKVGNILILALSLQYKEVAEVVAKAHFKQRDKYLSFCSKKVCPPVAKKTKTTGNLTDITPEERNLDACDRTPFFWEKFMPPTWSNSDVEHNLTMMVRHGFDLDILDQLDLFQIHLLCSHCDMSSFDFPSHFPHGNIPNHYSQLPPNYRVPRKFINKVQHALSSDLSSDEMLSSERFIPVDGTILKHYRQKEKGLMGSRTSAILSEDLRSTIFLLEYMLCFHAFSRYSTFLSKTLQNDIETIDYGGQNLIRYFEKMMYRGDDSIDTRTTKIHANKRAGLNHKRLGSCTHADCQTGERLLKTKAKSISSTAQPRGNSIFEEQTMTRIQEHTILSKFELYLVEQEMESHSTATIVNPTISKATIPQVARQKPHFKYDDSVNQWMQLDRKGKVVSVVDVDPLLAQAFFELEPNLDVYEMYGEVILCDKSRVRATPDYNQTGPWYDYVNVKWEIQESEVLFPARCLGFYFKDSTDDNGNSSNNLMALIHTAEKRSLSKCHHIDTLLTTQYFLDYNKSNRPKIYSIPCSTIESSILCLPHDIPPYKNNNKFNHRNQPLFDYKNNGIMSVRPRNQWSIVWMAWNKVLKESNSKARVMHRRPEKFFVNLGNEHEIRKVRKVLSDLFKQEMDDKPTHDHGSVN